MRLNFSALGVGAGIAVLIVGASSQLARAKDPVAAASFPDAHEAPPPGWTGRVFKLSADFPQQLPSQANLPWKKFDFKTQPREYMMAVLDYCLEGQEESDWIVQNNKVRKWYHTPWLHWGPSGREFINGQTIELAAAPGKLGPNQKRPLINSAVGVYNDIGAYEFGRIWKDPMNPKLEPANFPDGTVAFKRLNVNATEAELPFLKGSPTRQAYLPVDPGGVEADGSVNPPSIARHVDTVRLIQIDIAVRDSRNDDKTGWLLGTFVYDGNRPGNSPWKKIVPVGIMWGDSPGVTPETANGGKALTEQWINPDMKLWEWKQSPGLGWAGRMNGPLDDTMSSCMSCHGTAQLPMQPMVPPVFANNKVRLAWFKNTKQGKPFKAGGISSDYSLQMSMGIMNFLEWKEVTRSQRSPDALQQSDIFEVPKRFGHESGERADN